MRRNDAAGFKTPEKTWVVIDSEDYLITVTLRALNSDTSRIS